MEKMFNVCVTDKDGDRIYLEFIVAASSEIYANQKVLNALKKNHNEAMEDDPLCKYCLPLDNEWIVISSEEAKLEHGVHLIGYTRIGLHKDRLNKESTIAWMEETDRLVSYWLI